MATPPTLVSYTESTWTGSGTKTTATVSWQSGDIVVTIGGNEGTTGTLGTPTTTGSGLSFAPQQSNTAASTCAAKVCTAVASATSSGTLSQTNSANSGGFGVWVFRGSDGVGNSVEQHTATKTVNLTPAQVDSAICWAIFDFSAGTVMSAILPTPTNQRQRAQSASHYTYAVADLADQTSTGATAYGVTTTTAGPFSIVAIEIKGAAGAAAPAAVALKYPVAVNRASTY